MSATTGIITFSVFVLILLVFAPVVYVAWDRMNDWLIKRVFPDSTA